MRTKFTPDCQGDGFRMDSFHERLNTVYEQHPLTADSILHRLDFRPDSGRVLTELDLAVDDVSEITDQNHGGGLAAVLEIARAVPISKDTTVLDVGSGLGGPARALAHLIGCRVLGIELTGRRFRDAVFLTELVGLQDRVQFLQGDFLAVDLPGRAFEVILGLDSLSHFHDRYKLLQKCLRLCTPGGKVVIQDAILQRPPRAGEEQAALAELSNLWNVTLATREDWLAAAGPPGVLHAGADLSAEFAAHLHRQMACSPLHPSMAPAEVRAWEIAQRLVEVGVLGYERIVLALRQEANPTGG
jgi:SAM-dependent methyltransferase